MLIYVLIAIVVYLAVSQTLYPNLVSSQVTETSYSQFLEDVDNNKVVSAEIDTSNNTIKYTEGTGDSQKIYKTTAWPNDDSLATTLKDHGVDMTASIPDTSGDLWIYMLIAYGLPLVGLFLIGWWANRQMKKQMGDDGPSMNFGGGFGMGGGLGRSNAKEVKGEDTGVTFKDVAGQDEAKESLQEIVHRDWRQVPPRRVARRPSGHGQDAARQGRRRRGRRALLPDLRLRVRRDVRGPRCRQGARPLQAGQGESPLHRLH